MNAECKPSGYISMPNCRPFLPSALYAIHKPGRTNAWNDNNTHRHQCWPRVSHLETSAFLTLCHSFPVTCQQMCKNLKMWLTDLLTDKRTDRRTDKRVAGGHYCWGVLLWPPQLGLGGKCDKKWKLKNVEKITSFSDAVTLIFDLRPWKVNQVRTLSLPTNVYTKFENNPSRGFWVIALTPLRVAGGGQRAAGGFDVKP